MKKLSLKKLNLKANDLLERNQLKTVLGGDGGYTVASCSAKCGGFPPQGMQEWTAECYGDMCMAEDYIGCSTPDMSVSCADGPPN